MDVIADFDPTKVVKGMKKTGKDGAKKFVEGFNKITGATLPTSISGAIAYGISKALTSTKEKLATLKKEADDILGRDQNNDQVARETE